MPYGKPTLGGPTVFLSYIRRGLEKATRQTPDLGRMKSSAYSKSTTAVFGLGFLVHSARDALSFGALHNTIGRCAAEGKPSNVLCSWVPAALLPFRHFVVSTSDIPIATRLASRFSPLSLIAE